MFALPNLRSVIINSMCCVLCVYVGRGWFPTRRGKLFFFSPASLLQVACPAPIGSAYDFYGFFWVEFVSFMGIVAMGFQMYFDALAKKQSWISTFSIHIFSSAVSLCFCVCRLTQLTQLFLCCVAHVLIFIHFLCRGEYLLQLALKYPRSLEILVFYRKFNFL